MGAVFDHKAWHNGIVAGTYGALSVGATTQLTVDGQLVDFVVVHQGNPDGSLYDSSCKGTWLLMLDTLQTYSSRNRRYYEYTTTWHSDDIHYYDDCDVHNYLNDTFISLLSNAVQGAVKTVKIPYVDGYIYDAGVYNVQVMTGANGLTTKAFLLSTREVGVSVVGGGDTPVDGSKLSYFEDGSGDSAKGKRKVSSSSLHWLRSARKADGISTVYPYEVYSDGSVPSFSKPSESSIALRPCIIMPFKQTIIT